MSPSTGSGPADPHVLYEAIERAILGSTRAFTRSEAAEQAGVPLETSSALWRSLGFPGADDEDQVFLDVDIEALRMVAWLAESGFIAPGFELTLARSMGLSFARLAEWEVAELAGAALTGTMLTDPARLEEMISGLIPVMEDIQNYVWRRHLANAAGRILLRPSQETTEGGSALAVGFADIVGFTRRSRGLSSLGLAQLVEVFENTSSRIVSDHNGRVIKTLGDEVLFVADDPVDLARIGLALVQAAEEVEDFPEIRVGAAYGEVLSRMGDVFGPVVNIAARLTSLCRPGKILVDRELAGRLKDRGDMRVRRGRTTSVKGYSRLDTWTLRPPREG